MKLKIDFDTKVITLEKNVNLGEFISKIEAFIPDWKDWKLDTNTIVNWTAPVYRGWPYWYNTPYLTTANDLGNTKGLSTSSNRITNDLVLRTAPIQKQVCLEL
jgi:hypothetical protein